MVVGAGDTAAEEATYLAKLCTKVTMLVRRDIMRASKAMQKRVFNTKNITVLFNHETKSINGEKGVESVTAYNNKTLDMKFFNNVEATYEGSELYSQKADYSNSNSFLTISENVKIKDQRGTMVADKLFFDIKKQKLNIASFNDGKINANINLK